MSSSKTTFWIIGTLLLLTGLRMVLAANVGLSPDEAYYYLWSERLDWAYYSKGPGVAFAIRLGTEVLGPTELGVRLLSPLLALGSSILLFVFAKRLYGLATAVGVVVLVNALPIFNVGGVVMTIDPLSIFFWIAATLTFWLALERLPRFTVWWPATGFLIGLGFLCKYTNAFQLLSLVLVLALNRRHRVQLLRPGFATLLAAFCLGLIPPILWNKENGWITLVHLLDRGGISTGGTWRPLEIFEFLGVHLGVYSPILFVGMVIAGVAAVKEARSHFRPFFLLCFSLPIILVYFALSLKQAGEANWTAPGFVTLSLVTAAYWTPRLSSPLVRKWAMAGVALSLALTFVLLCSDLVRMAGVPWPYKSDPGGRLRGWETAAREIAELRRELEESLETEVFLIANRYGTASALAFYLPEKRLEGPGHPPIYTPGGAEIKNQFAFWPRYDEFVLMGGESPSRLHEEYTEEAGVNPFVGRTAMMITDDIKADGVSPKSPFEVRRSFEGWERLGDLVINRRGLVVRRYRLFVCFDYKTPDL
ncbi:MAG: glycosyltransferase family 39 protein [Verrucomicrobiia bacterium]